MPLKPFTGTLDDASQASSVKRPTPKLQPFTGDLDAPAAAEPAVARPKVEPSSMVRRVLGDTAVDLGKGIIGVGEAAVGLANIPTFGAVGKGLEAVGFDPATSKKMLEEGYTPERVEANRKVAEAKGFVGTAAEMIKNPSTIAGSIVESAPLMVGGGAVARGLGAVGGMVSRPILRAAIGEGAVGAGSAAEQTRQQTDDGMLSPGQVAASVGSGVGTGLLGLAGGSVARRLGIGDVDVALAGGQTVTRPRPNIVRRALEGAVSEGVLEELPQSMQEQAWQNLATGKPIGEGVAEAGAQGVLTGGAMGGAFSAVSRPHVEGENQEGDPSVARPKVVSPATGQASDLPDPANGPLSAAVNTAAATGAIPTATGRGEEPSAPLFEGAQPGSLADAGNAIPRAGKPQNEDMFKRQHAEQMAAEQARAATQAQVDPSTGEILTPPGEDGAAPVVTRWLDEGGNARRPSHEEVTAYLQEKMVQAGAIEKRSVLKRDIQALVSADGEVLEAKLFNPAFDEARRALFDEIDANAAPEDQAGDQAAVGAGGYLDDGTAAKQAAFAEGMRTGESVATVLRRQEQQAADAVAAVAEGGADGREAEVGTGRLSGEAAAAADLRVGEAGGTGEEAAVPGQVAGAPAASTELTPAEDRPTSELAPARAPLSVRMGGNEYPVESYEDASRKFNELKGKVDVGGMPVVELVDQGGKPVGYLGQGGEVYEGNFQEQRLKPGRQEPVYRPPSGEALPNPAVIEGQATRVAPEAAGVETQAAIPEAQAQRGETPVPARDASPVAAAAATAATSPANDLPEPTDAQKEAGNYQKGHVRVAGMDISIENPAGSKRRPEWPALKHHYGYIRGTIGKDKDHVDVFLTDNAEDTSRPVFVVDQKKADGSFDESKAMLGFANQAEARAAYLSNYPKGWEKSGFGGIKQMSQDEFKAWVRDAEATKKPAAGRTAQIQQGEPPSSESGSAQIGESAPPSVNTLVGRIADGEHTTKVLQGLDDKTARAVAVAMGHRFAKTAKAGNIISNLEAKSQPDLRRAAARAFEVMATPEEKAQLEASRPARSKAYNEKVRTEEQNIALRQRERRDGTLARDNGEPFKNQTAATRALSELPESGEFARDGFGLFKTEGGFVLRRWETTGTGAIDSGWMDQKEAIRRRESARADTAAKQGLVVDKFGNMVTPEEAARIDEVFDDYGEPRPGYDENGNKTAETATEPDNAAKPADAHDARWDAMTAAQREDVLKQDGGWGTAPGAKMALNPTGRKIAARAWADQVEGTRATIARLMDRQPATGKIVDLGEKIGGARKDTAVKTGSKGKSLAGAKDTRPTWAKRYEIAQIAKSMNPEEEGRWAISDSRRKDYLGQPVRPTRQTFATREEAEKALPLLELARQHRAVSRGDGFAIVRDVTDRKRVVLKEGFASRDEAMRYMAEHATELLETVTSVGEEALPLPDDVARTGPARRTGNVDGNDFLETFGFRGVEFGNWNNQVERQEVMNHAFDGLHDMAEILGIPPKAISLNGELALAFGARGHGLSGARAHYEPVRGVINLTKMQGAGALAHEWLHALDHYLGRQAGTARRERTRSEDGGQLFKDADADQFLSHNGWARHGDQMRAELRAAFKNVMDTISTKAEAYVEDTKQAERFLGHARDQLAQRLSEIRANLARKADWGKKTAPASAEQLAEIDEITQRLLDGKDLETRLIDTGKKAMPRGSLAHLRNSNDSLERLNAIMKTVRGRQGFNSEQRGTLDYLRYEMANYATRIKALNDAKGETTKTRKMPTSFRMEAIKADQGRATNYWATPHELAARAFSAYVEDKLDERGIGSNFLSYGSEHRFVLPIPEFPRPFPGGKEREAINAAFDAFFREVKTREEGGKVALYSRRGWDESFPDAVLALPPRTLSAHPDYAAAKGGDDTAALRLARDIVTPDYVEALRAGLPETGATFVVPVRAVEAAGKNRIPAMAAEVVASKLGLKTAPDIVQATQVSRGGSKGMHRLANTPEFAGPVERGASYLILDDTLTQGGTLAALKTYIEDQGGKVVLATALTGQARSAKLAPSATTLKQLRERYGSIEPWWRDTFGYGFDGLTESEAKFMVTLEDRPTAEQLRDRVAAARVPGQRALGPANDRVGRDRPALSRTSETPPTGGVSRSGLSVNEGQRLKQALTAKWGENAPRVVLVEDASGLADAARAAGHRLSAADVDRVEGMYLGKPTVWLNLAEIPTAERFREVLTHEALGHYGVEQVLGKAEWASITQAIDQHVKNGTGAQDLRDAIAQLRRTQPDIFDSAETVAKEVIAVMAERGSRNGLVQRVIAGIRRFLRRLMPDQRWTDGEIRDLIHQADRFMHAGRTNEQQQARTRALAFSRAEEQSSEIEADTAFVAGLTEKERNAPAMVAFAQAMYADLGTNSPFFQDWFGDSKVVDKSGAPAVAYHGTGEEFAAFDPQRLGKSTNHLTAALGIFFDTRRAKAEHYARVATNDVPADQVILEGYLAIQKPYAMSKDEFMAVDSIERAREIRARLEKEGYDGIQLPEVGQWIAFKPEQFKRTDNRGTFNSGDARMLFSKAPAEAIEEDDPAQERTPAEVLDGIELDKRPLSLAIKGGLTWLKKNFGLGLLPANYLADFAPESIRGRVKAFMRIKRRMDSFRGEKQAEIHEVEQEWLKYVSMNRQESPELAGVMHESTLAGVDPSKETSEPLQFEYAGKRYDATEENAKIVKKALKKQALGRGADNKNPFYEFEQEIDGKVASEKERPDAHARLRARWLKLSPEAQALYARVRDHNSAMTAEWDQIVLDNIDKAEQQAMDRVGRDYERTLERLRDEGVTGDELTKAKARASNRHDDDLAKLKKQRDERYQALKATFESQRLSGPYFAITRFGDFFVAIRDKSGKLLSWSQFDDASERDWYVQQVKKKAPEATAWDIKTGVMSNLDEVKGAVDAGFMVDIESILTDAAVPKDVKDAIWQRYLQTLPDFSIRKGFIHRKGTHGFQKDALKAYGSRMFHMSHQMAKLKYGIDLEDTVTAARETARKLPGDSTDADMLVNELQQRLKWVMNPTGGSFAQKISSFAFLWNLAVSPAAAIVNWTQTPMIGIPVLGARLGGTTKAAAALLRASSDLVKSKHWHVVNALEGEERDAMEEFFIAGLLDRTQSHATAGVGDQGVEYNAVREKWMAKASFLFHHVERINRETTALAAYRLARAQGQGHQQAIDTAMELTWRTHFDMSNSSRARLLTSDFAKIAMTHRAHSLNMSAMLIQNIRAMLGKTASKEERQIARHEFMGIMGSHAFMAGVMGVPFYGLTMLLAGLGGDMVGDDDDDDERTMEDKLKALLYETLPKWMADTVLYGAPSTATGLSLYNRIGFPDLFFRSSDRDLDGKDEADYAIAQVLGPAWAIPPQIWTGLSQMREGHFSQGVEKMTPKAIRDGLKAIRYGREGILNLQGDPVVDSANAWNMIGQAAGFAPFKVSEAYEQRNAKTRLQERINTRRAQAVNKYKLAVVQHDTAGIQDALGDIRSFNKAYPEKPITTQGLRQSVLGWHRRQRRLGVAGMNEDQRLEARISRQLGF